MYHLKIEITRTDELNTVVLGDPDPVPERVSLAVPLLKAEVDVRDPRDLKGQVSAVADMLAEWET